MGKLTGIGSSTADDIFVKNLNLVDDIMDKFTFVDLVYYLLAGRRPTDNEARMLNMILVIGSDHGMTPSSISARLTYLGSPESLQGAIAAGLLGAGNRYLGAMQICSELLIQQAEGLFDDSEDSAVRQRAVETIDLCRSQKVPITGVGHPIHVNGDPRAAKMREVAKTCGFYGVHWRLMDAIADEFLARGKPLPLNAVGGTGACIADMGLEPRIGRGLAIIGRAAGLLAHVLEERTVPVGQEIWDLVLNADARQQSETNQGV